MSERAHEGTPDVAVHPAELRRFWSEQGRGHVRLLLGIGTGMEVVGLLSIWAGRRLDARA